MDRNHSMSRGDHVERQLSHLKILSRLLGHELSGQTGSRVTLSREEVVEIRTTLDLFIEDIMGGRSSSAGTATSVTRVEPEVVPARIN
ncbi:MAG: hypothetical protein ACI8TQ_000849 [Planctomycetota bacterium]|jgi:hypothetical protein